ncbi:MAG: NADAR family protein [Bacteroides sp.]|nr:NADAR family protein [Bacteroides sp.]
MSKLSIAQFIQEFYPQYYQWNEYPAEMCIPFSKVKEQWGILGNFAPTPLVVDGVDFVNSEQLFQVMKFNDADTLKALLSSKGMKIKYAAKAAEKLGHRRPDWGQIIVDAMKFCLQTKFEQSEQFRHTLHETAGKIIVEDQTCFNKKTADTWGAKLIDGKYEGSNLLGRLLMELRDNGKLDYNLPSDIFAFINTIKVE